MEVHVRHLLPRRLAIGQGQRDPLTPRQRRLEPTAHTPHQVKHLIPLHILKLSERRHMTSRNYQHMPRIDRANVQKGNRPVAFRDADGRDLM